MKRSMTFAKQKPPKHKAAGGLKSFPKQKVAAMTTKPGHRVPPARKPPPLAKKGRSGL